MFYFIRLKKILDLALIKISAIAVICIFAFGCVGTIQEASKDKTLTQKVGKPELIFAGAQTLTSISHNKIEVYFYPASGGSGKYTYKIYYGGEPVPQVTSSDILNTDYRGLLRFTLTGLESARDYIIRVDVEDQINGKETITNTSLKVRTFSNKVSDFYGISEVSNLSGVDGIDSLKVRWIHAECFDPLRCDQGSDPERYEIIILDRTNKGLTPVDFNNANLNASDGRIVKTVNFDSSINSTIVRGLRGKTDYYIVVRSIHRDSAEDIGNPQLRGELNNSYLEMKTLDDDLASIVFDTSSLLLTKLPGENGKNSLKAEWTAGVGVFDHYRLFYVSDLTNLSAANIPSNCQATFMPGDDARTTVLCKKISFSESSVVTTDLLKETNYQYILVLCQNVECTSGNRIIADKKELSTSLERPEFGGINEIKEASDINDLNFLTILFSGVDTDENYIDGYVVEYKDTANPSQPALYEVLSSDDPGLNPGDLFFEPFNENQATAFRIGGVEYYSGKVYCFRMYPFVYNSDGDRVVYENDNWVCKSSPEYQEPKENDFKGLRSTITQGDQVTLRWDIPFDGLFEEYEVYYVDNSSGVDLFGSVPVDLDGGSSSSYGRFIIMPGQTELTLSGFQNGDSYKFGILTNFNSSQGKLRSEENSNVISCNFSTGQNTVCTGGF